MALGEFIGFAAALLTFTTFYMRTMVPLRLVGISSNVAFISYALIEGLVPILVLHSTLLPLNLFRLHEILKLVQDMRKASTDELALDPLLPFMTRRRFRAGEILFRKGDPSHEMFYVRSGVIRLDEIGRTLGEGDVMGEISVFSPSHKRTVTAVCETGGELMQMSDDQVLRLYHQNPRFGFYVVRLITRRLIENYEALLSKQEPPELGLRAHDPGGEPPYPMSDTRAAPGPGGRKTIWIRIGWACIGVAAASYAGWLFAPYLTSVVSRDAAVTTWVHIATAPIRGSLDGPPMAVGQRLGADGEIVGVRNLQADPSWMERSAAEVARAETNVADLRAFVAHMQSLDANWRGRTANYADTFKRNLEIEIDGARQELAYITERLALERAVAERKQALARHGNTSKSEADDALAEVMELERMRAEREMAVAHAEERRRAADRGVFLASDGRSPEWAFDSEDQVQLEIAQAKRALADAEAALIEARAAAVAARQAFELISASPITAPPGSLVWSVIAGAGAAVEPGTPVIEWIDCSVILVDVPVSDVEIGLLRHGMRADVILEGDTEVRQGSVLLTRGAASVLGAEDLAALAKGHGGGRGQAIVRLEDGMEDANDCPIGVAAWVDFPEIDVIDVLRARLRL